VATGDGNPMDPTGLIRRPITVVAAAGPVLNPAIERSLRDHPDIEVVGAADTIVDGGTVIVDLVPRLVVLGLDLDRDPAGVREMCHELFAQLPVVHILVVAEIDWGRDLWSCIGAGAHATWLTRRSPVSLDGAIVALERRRSCLTPHSADYVLAAYEHIQDDATKVLAATPPLTDAERGALQGLADGSSPRELAEPQERTPGTISRYAYHAIAKLHRTYHDHKQLQELA
jgi:DNA-binding NarL/FixJ family response regulator